MSQFCNRQTDWRVSLSEVSMFASPRLPPKQERNLGLFINSYESIQAGRGFMNASVRGAMTRIFILLLFVCAGTYAWEASRNSDMQPVTGQVIGTVYKGYRIGYELQEQRYQFETRLGIVDSFGDLHALPVGADIPLLVNPASYQDPVINTLNGRHGITLSFVALLCLFVVIVLISASKKGGRKQL
ncbi:MAG: hypothetical protein RBR82_02835 [Pseudomonas sp.]|nr:hypothetical protein [Pseudomonas sp.]